MNCPKHSLTEFAWSKTLSLEPSKHAKAGRLSYTLKPILLQKLKNLVFIKIHKRTVLCTYWFAWSKTLSLEPNISFKKSYCAERAFPDSRVCPGVDDTGELDSVGDNDEGDLAKFD